MNKNQRRLRKNARNGLYTGNVHSQYDKTLDTARRPTDQSFVTRQIATVLRPRLSKQAKVAYSAEEITKRAGRKSPTV